jgi:hypothetical protein
MIANFPQNFIGKNFQSLFLNHTRIALIDSPIELPVPVSHHLNPHVGFLN